MVAGLGSVFGASRDEDAAVVGLDRTKPNWDRKVDVQHLSLLSFLVDVVECHDFLVELEEMDFVCHYLLYSLLVVLCRLSDQPDAGLFEIVGHRKLRVSVKANVLALLAVWNLLGQLVISAFSRRPIVLVSAS